MVGPKQFFYEMVSHFASKHAQKKRPMKNAHTLHWTAVVNGVAFREIILIPDVGSAYGRLTLTGDGIRASVDMMTRLHTFDTFEWHHQPSDEDLVALRLLLS